MSPHLLPNSGLGSLPSKTPFCYALRNDISSVIFGSNKFSSLRFAKYLHFTILGLPEFQLPFTFWMLVSFIVSNFQTKFLFF